MGWPLLAGRPLLPAARCSAALSWPTPTLSAAGIVWPARPCRGRSERMAATRVLLRDASLCSTGMALMARGRPAGQVDRRQTAPAQRPWTFGSTCWARRRSALVVRPHALCDGHLADPARGVGLREQRQDLRSPASSAGLQAMTFRWLVTARLLARRTSLRHSNTDYRLDSSRRLTQVQFGVGRSDGRARDCRPSGPNWHPRASPSTPRW